MRFQRRSAALRAEPVARLSASRGCRYREPRPMIPVYQTMTTANDGMGNCMGACVASIMELPLRDVLHRPGPTPPGQFWRAWEDWFIARGLFLNHRGEPPNGYAIAGGNLIRQGKRCGHYVVVFNGEVVHDPYPLGGKFGPAVEWFTIDPIREEQRPYCDERLTALAEARITFPRPDRPANCPYQLPASLPYPCSNCQCSARDSDGTASAALCEDIAVPQDCQARPSPKDSPNEQGEM